MHFLVANASRKNFLHINTFTWLYEVIPLQGSVGFV